MLVVSIVGARPQFIKAAVVSRTLRTRDGIEEVLVHTGQHYDANMSDVFFNELHLPAPDHHLGIGSGPHGAQTGHMLAAIEALLLARRPDWVVVYGDTNSTLAGALAAAKLHIPTAHVEAGLRSFNRRMPEEINRVVTDHVADLLLAPTATAAANLVHEGVPAAKVHLVGDVMYDALLQFRELALARDTLGSLGIVPGGYVLATVHRAENTDDDARLRAVFEALATIAQDVPVVLPLHPRTRSALARAGLLPEAESRLRIIPPVGYLDMVALTHNATMVATDSGGLQKESFLSGVPVVVLREETEWVELVDLGWNHLSRPLTKQKILESYAAAMACRAAPPPRPEIFGDGRAAEWIAERLQATAGTTREAA